MKVKYIIGDDISGYQWCGMNSPRRFSKPGIDSTKPMYFDSEQQARTECEMIEKYYPQKSVLMVVSRVFLFDPEESPAEKFETLLPKDKLISFDTSPFGKSFKEFEQNTRKATCQQLLTKPLSLN